MIRKTILAVFVVLLTISLMSGSVIGGVADNKTTTAPDENPTANTPDVTVERGEYKTVNIRLQNIEKPFEGFIVMVNETGYVVNTNLTTYTMEDGGTVSIKTGPYNESTTVEITLYKDNGDGEFSPESDDTLLPRDPHGEFKVTLESEITPTDTPVGTTPPPTDANNMPTPTPPPESRNPTETATTSPLQTDTSTQSQEPTVNNTDTPHNDDGSSAFNLALGSIIVGVLVISFFLGYILYSIKNNN
jgi:hypothetical protein